MRVVEWYAPDAARDHAQLERWCRTVGPLVIDSVPRGHFGSLVPGDLLLVGAWNTDGGAGFLTRFIQTELGIDCSATPPRRRSGAPHVVLLLQEALRRSVHLPTVEEQWVTPPPIKEEDHPGPRRDVVEVARACGLAHFYAPAARNGPGQRDGKGEDKGNAILSTLPLHDLIVIELPFESARRVVVAATIRDDRGDSLRVASVHFISTPQPWRVLTTGNSSRLRQALGLLDALRRAELARARSDACAIASEQCPAGGERPEPVPPTVATLVGGDLNTWSTRETALRHLRRHFPQSPPTLRDGTRGPFPTDHLLYRHGPSGSRFRLLDGSYRRLDNRYYSDHHPIVAQVLIGPQ